MASQAYLGNVLVLGLGRTGESAARYPRLARARARGGRHPLRRRELLGGGAHPRARGARRERRVRHRGRGGLLRPRRGLARDPHGRRLLPVGRGVRARGRERARAGLAREPGALGGRDGHQRQDHHHVARHPPAGRGRASRPSPWATSGRLPPRPCPGRAEGGLARGGALELPACRDAPLPPARRGASERHAGPPRVAPHDGGLRRRKGACLRQPGRGRPRRRLRGRRVVPRRGRPPGGARRAHLPPLRGGGAGLPVRGLPARRPRSWCAWTAPEHELLPAADLQIFGLHNAENALAAAAVALELGVAADDVRSGLRSFSPIEHRIEPRRVRGWGVLRERLQGHQHRLRGEGSHRL